MSRREKIEYIPYNREYVFTRPCVSEEYWSHEFRKTLIIDCIDLFYILEYMLSLLHILLIKIL